jgi:Tfp pilus assembly protein FimV
MMKKSLLSLACTCALFASDTELEQLKQQMAQLQQQLNEMQKHIG